MINIIRSLFNINKKLYIIVNDKCGARQGKLARACATVGQRNPHMRFSPVIVVKGGEEYPKLRYLVKNICGEHIDAGRTQVESGTSLAFGSIVHKDKKIDLPLY